MSALGTLGWMTPIAIAAAGACALIFRYLVALLGLVVTLRGANVEDRASIFDAFVAAIRPHPLSLIRRRGIQGQISMSIERFSVPF